MKSLSVDMELNGVQTRVGKIFYNGIRDACLYQTFGGAADACE